MNDEELKKCLQEVNEKLAALGDENKISGKERKLYVNLRLEKNSLEKIKSARQKGNSTQEVLEMANYAMLKSMQSKHPFLAYLMQIKMRGYIWG